MIQAVASRGILGHQVLNHLDVLEEDGFVEGRQSAGVLCCHPLCRVLESSDSFQVAIFHRFVNLLDCSLEFYRLVNFHEQD